MYSDIAVGIFNALVGQFLTDLSTPARALIMNNNQILYDIYCRKSMEEEDRQVLSLEAQEKECKEYADKNGLKIRKIWRESYSAKAPGRKLFNQMMQELAEGKIQGILAWHPDRLSRNSVDGGLIIYHLDKGIIKDLVFPTYTFENTPQGKWMLNIQFGQSKYYVDMLSVNVKRGNRMKLENGWRPNMAPAGYLNQKEDKTIIADPDRFPIIQRAFREIIAGHSTVMEALNKLNNEWGYKSLMFKKRGGQPLSRSSIYHLLTNSFYCGIIQYDGKEYQGKHPKMLTIEEFDKLQIVLGQKGKPRQQVHSFPLTTIIRCGECGSMITAETKTKYYPKTKNTAVYTYYRCTKKNPKIKCSQPYIREEAIEEQIDQYLSKITIPEEFKDWALKYLDYVNEHEAKVEQLSYKNINQQIEDTREELRNLTRLRIREQIDDTLFEDEKKNIQKEIKRLEELLTETNRQADEWVELMDETFNFAYYAQLHFEFGEDPMKRYIFSKLGSNFLLKDKILALELKKEYFAFTPEYRKQIKPLGLDDQRLFMLQKNNLVPADLRSRT